MNFSFLRKEYQDNGFCIIRNVVDSESAKQIVAHVKWLRIKYPNTRPEAFHHHMLINEPFIHHLIENKKILDIVEKIIGPNIALFGAHYIAKKPIDGMPVGWHQDGSYWPLEPMKVVSVWLAGTHSKKNNGCMQLIPKTHKKRLYKPSELKKMDSNKYVLDLAIHPKKLDKSKVVDIELNPGDISIHNPFIIHGSNANKSKSWRIGLTLRYIPTSTFVNRNNWKCVFLRGEINRNVKNTYVKRPIFKKEVHMAFDSMNNFKK